MHEEPTGKGGQVSDAAQEIPSACVGYDAQVWAQSGYEADEQQYVAFDRDGDGVACPELPDELTGFAPTCPWCSSMSPPSRSTSRDEQRRSFLARYFSVIDSPGTIRCMPHQVEAACRHPLSVRASRGRIGGRAARAFLSPV